MSDLGYGCAVQLERPWWSGIARKGLRLARLFSTTPDFWLNLQRDHDLSKAQAEIGGQLRKLVHPLDV